MELQLSEEQLLVQKTAAEFSRNEVPPKAAAIDRDHRHPTELVARMAEPGFGGRRAGAVRRGGPEHGVLCADSGRGEPRLRQHRRHHEREQLPFCAIRSSSSARRQKQKWLVPLASGRLLGCFALSGAEAGSDAAAQKTVARPDGDGFVITGSENWITNGPVAQCACCKCMFDPPPAGHRRSPSFILPMDTPGVRCGPPDKKLGIRGSQSCQIFLDDVRLSREHPFGEVGRGSRWPCHLDGGRIGIAAQALGIARAAAYEDAGRYAPDRKTFSSPFASHQSIQWKLADMATEIDARGCSRGARRRLRIGSAPPGVGDGEAVRWSEAMQPRRQGGGPDLRRQRLRRGLPRRAPLPRCQDH